MKKGDTFIVDDDDEAWKTTKPLAMTMARNILKSPTKRHGRSFGKIKTQCFFGLLLECLYNKHIDNFDAWLAHCKVAADAGDDRGFDGVPGENLKCFEKFNPKSGRLNECVFVNDIRAQTFRAFTWQRHPRNVEYVFVGQFDRSAIHELFPNDTNGDMLHGVRVTELP